MVSFHTILGNSPGEQLDWRWVETQGLFGGRSEEECLLQLTGIITVLKKTEKEEITDRNAPCEY
jgi:hypothetical protein